MRRRRQLAHDQAGNLVLDESGLVYEYDHENRLVRVSCGAQEHARYTYDALGRKVEAVVEGVTTRYYYDGQNVIVETDGNDALRRYFVNGPLDASALGASSIDERVLVHDASTGDELYYLLQELYTVAGLANAAGAMSSGYRYNAYGEARDVTSDNPYYFTGRPLDVVCDKPLYDYRARSYDPINGRFLQRDPGGYNDSANLFEYVVSSPVNWVDWTGASADVPANGKPGTDPSAGPQSGGSSTPVPPSSTQPAAGPPGPSAPPIGPILGPVEDVRPGGVYPPPLYPPSARYMDDCESRLVAVCRKYKCCAQCPEPKCRDRAKEICFAYVHKFQMWNYKKNPNKKDNRSGFLMCVEMADLVHSFGLSNDCFKIRRASTPDLSHTFAAVFHVCNKREPPHSDAKFDPWRRCTRLWPFNDTGPLFPYRPSCKPGEPCRVWDKDS